MSKLVVSRSIKDSGIRPIGCSKIEIAFTFKDSGVRPVEKSPDFLVPTRQN